MRIAINAADLDNAHVDGTRIYIQNLLRNFGRFEKNDRFLIYHKKKFNPQLEFPIFENYEIKKHPFPFWWTQIRFSWEIFREKPEILFMPMHSLPFLRSKKMKTIVTIHDLAFKFFPEYFSKKDLRRLNLFTDYAAKNADKLIAISNSTKKDLLKIYPDLKEENIKAIYHGYDKKLFNENISEEKIKETKTKYHIPFQKYIIHAGVVRPRKNIKVLLRSFRSIKKQKKYQDLGLVIAGRLDDAGIPADLKKTKDVVVTGIYKTEDLPALLKGSEVLVFPSLYEGFGIPIIEAMACGIPVAVADNSSLSEIVGEAGILFDPYSEKEIAEALIKILENEKIRDNLREKGLKKVENFSWEKCAKETLEWIKR